MLLRCLGKEPLSRSHITPSAQEEVDGAPLFIDGPVEVNPLAAYLDISLVSRATSHPPAGRTPANAFQNQARSAAPTARSSYEPTGCRARPSFGPGHGN